VGLRGGFEGGEVLGEVLSSGKAIQIGEFCSLESWGESSSLTKELGAVDLGSGGGP